MAAHPSTPAGGHNLPVLSVGQISQAIKRQVEGAFEFVRVRGEMTGLRRAASGHLYFSLKDENASLKGVCWRQVAARIATAPEEGLEVVVEGRLTTYPDRSEYQIVASAIQIAGAGALLMLLEERKRKWAAEGLFAAENKKALPYLPELIGIVTSSSGAVLRDILHRLSGRFPRRVLLWPVAVQGETAAGQVAAAINGFNAMPCGDLPRPDIIIVARGGGSVEDLWPFNEEAVVRAAASSVIPVISAIGHETDTTLLDYAADLRAPTPTAAAELAVPVRIELLSRLKTCEDRLAKSAERYIKGFKIDVASLDRGLPKPVHLVQAAGQRLDDWSERLKNSASANIRAHRMNLQNLAQRLVAPQAQALQGHREVTAMARALQLASRSFLNRGVESLSNQVALLESLSYVRTLARGFVLAYDQEMNVVCSVHLLKNKMPLLLRFKDGERHAVVGGRLPKPHGSGSATAREDEDVQSALF